MRLHTRKTNSGLMNRRILDLRIKGWLNIIILCLITAIPCTFGYYHQQYVHSIERLEGGLNLVAHAQEYVVPSPTPTPTNKDIVFSHKHGDIIWRIYSLESSRGKEGYLYCERKGMFNDFGFNVANKQCFINFEHEVEAVDDWFDTELKTHPLANALCIYNEGVDRADCPYAKHFVGL